LSSGDQGTMAERESANPGRFFLDLQIVSAARRWRSRGITPIGTADWSEHGRIIVAKFLRRREVLPNPFQIGSRRGVYVEQCLE